MPLLGDSGPGGATRDDRYKPVFEPAVAVLEVLPRLRFVSHGLSNDEAEPDAIKAFWSVSSKLRRKIRGDADAWARSKPAKVALAAKYWSQRSQVLLAARCDTISGRITALWSSHPSVGTGRVPVSNQGKVESKTVAAWWNSTPARLMLLNLRSKKLTYPKWSVAQLLTVCIPKPDNPAWLSLAEAWKEACDIKMLPLSQGEYRTGARDH